MNGLDSLFINLKAWILDLPWIPEKALPLVSMAVSISAILMVFPFLFAMTTVVERKLLGRIQNRYGPNRVGPFGFLQWAADGIKTLTKENVVPRSADKIVHFLAPLALLCPVLLAFSIIPFGRNMTPIELDAGLLFFFAVGAGTELAVFMAGWSSRNKYSLLGSMRAVAQMISYEMPLLLSAISVVMMVGSMNLNDIVAAQSEFSGWIPNWHVLTPWGLLGCFIFLIAAMAESNRSPFDLPEAESEIIAGYFVEYSGMKFALFFLGEYMGLFVMGGLWITLFFGGWQAPLPFEWLQWFPSWGWFILKLTALIFFFIWTRGTLPRVRTDQLMALAWKFLLPLSLFNLVVAGLWRFSSEVAVIGQVVRWTLGFGLVFVLYVAFGSQFGTGRRFARRTYKYVD